MGWPVLGSFSRKLQAVLARSWPFAVAPRIEVPIKQITLPNASIRYAVDITVGGISVEAMLDSGSTGLRLLPGAVPPDALQPLGEPALYAYSNGVELRGQFARAALRIGDLACKQHIRVHAVEELACVAHKPNCPAAQIRDAGYLMFGEGFRGHGFRAVMGIGLRPAGAVNPLAHMGACAWIVNLPLPKCEGPGTLIINPTRDERRAYHRYALQRQRAVRKIGTLKGWNDVLPGYLLEPHTNRRVPGPVSFDTGAPFISIVSKDPQTLAPWMQGTAGMLLIQDQSQTEPLRVSFEAQRQPGGRIHTHLATEQQPSGIRAGTLPYYSFSVLYDCRRGIIGLKSRTGR